MILDENFNPKKSLFLYEYKKKFIFLKKLISTNNFPSSLLLSGNKGIGKFTLISHLLHFYFDNINYDDNNNQIKLDTAFHYQFLDNLFPNILYLSSSNYKNVTIDDIRKLKQKLLITPILNKKRFIILDDVETFNLNCLNALLKILEEPGKNNHFILIDNKSKPLINTIKSRCIKIKFVLDELSRVKIINNFDDLHDALECCKASSHIPYFTSNHPVYYYKNLTAIDGGFFPVPHYNYQKPDLFITPNIFKNNYLKNYCDIKNLNIKKLIDLGYQDAKENKKMFDEIF